MGNSLHSRGNSPCSARQFTAGSQGQWYTRGRSKAVSARGREHTANSRPELAFTARIGVRRLARASHRCGRMGVMVAPPAPGPACPRGSKAVTPRPAPRSPSIPIRLSSLPSKNWPLMPVPGNSRFWPEPPHADGLLVHQSYAELFAALNGVAHLRRSELADWVGSDLDPERFVFPDAPLLAQGADAQGDSCGRVRAQGSPPLAFPDATE